MSVVAALRIEGIPTIIGDFLLTDNDTTKPHIFLPTRPDINSSPFGHLDRRVAGMRRKIHIFNDNFVAGFTGSVKAGEEVFADLEHRFSTKAPTIHELDDAFQRFNTKYSNGASVAGWTMRSRPTCFSWSAAPGSRARKVTHEIIGSGTEHFTNLLTGADMRGHSDSVALAWDKAVLVGLTKIGGLVTEELSSGKNLEAAYGYGGEMIILTSAGFRAVEKFMLTFWNVRIEDDGTINYLPSNVVAVYQNMGRYTAVQVTHLAFADQRLTARDTYVMAITPIHDPMDSLNVKAIGRLELSAPYYFMAFSVVDMKSGKTGLFKMTAQSGPGSVLRHIKRDGIDYLEMDRKMIEQYIANMFNVGMPR
jgi:hypothetical protein